MRAWLGIGLLCLCSGAALAADKTDASQSEQDLKAARTHWQKGRVDEAIEAYEALAPNKSLAEQVVLGLSRCHESAGDYEQAVAVIQGALGKAAKSGKLWARLAELQFVQGQYAEAEKSVTKALELEVESPLARLVRADLYTQTGRLQLADEDYRWFVRYYNRAQPTDAETLLLVGRGSAQYARWHKVPQIFNFVVNTLCTDALKDDPDAWQATVLSGDLLLEKYNKAQALPEFRKALSVNPRAAEAFVSLGNASLQEFELTEAGEFADRALEVNPRSVAALQLKADLKLNDGDTAAALQELGRALAVNPRDQQTLARVAACYILEDGPPPAAELEQVLTHLDAVGEIKLKQPSRFSRLMLELLAVNPRPAYFLTSLGTALEARRKFELAERLYALAIETMPQLPDPKTSLGLLYMRIGRSDDARKILDSAFDADPFHVRVSNMRKVLSLLEGYGTIQTDHFVIRFDSAADKILARYMADYLEEQYPALVEQFGFEPPARTTFEIYNKAKGLSAHQWFSARMVGLPWIQTIGASTGMMVALASPTSEEQQFNWARVLKHEFIHILTLQQTQFNIPHWFTEALATMNEGYSRPATWDKLLLERLPKGELMNLDTINLGFIRPKTPSDWQLAYCQSELYAQYMVEKFGPQSLPGMLNAYRDNLGTAEAIRRVFQIDVAEFEQGYLDYVKQIVSGLKASGDAEPEQSLAEIEKAHLADPEDATAAGRYAAALLELKRLAEARQLAHKALIQDPSQPDAAVVMAKLEMRAADVKAAADYLQPALDRERPNAQVLELFAALQLKDAEYEKAAELYELGRNKHPSKSVWLKGLAVCYLQLDEDDKLSEVLRELTDRDSDDPVIRKKLAEIEVERQHFEPAIAAAKSALQIDVLDPDLHRLLGEAYTGLRQFPSAAAELAVAVELKPDDLDLQLALARAQQSAGEQDAAAATLRKLLETDPQHGEARKLLGELKP